jgi:hypothetical protein
MLVRIRQLSLDDIALQADDPLDGSLVGVVGVPISPASTPLHRTAGQGTTSMMGDDRRETKNKKQTGK